MLLPSAIQRKGTDLQYGKRRTLVTVCDLGPCHHGMARPQVADGGTASYMEDNCE